jgi:hypothetical protein
MWLLVPIILVASLSPLCAQQDDDTIRYVHGLPETGEDTLGTSKTPPSHNLVPVSVQQVPPALHETLDSDRLFLNWRNEEILFDKNTGLYWIRFHRAGVIRSYGIARNGTVVRVEEEKAESGNKNLTNDKP